MKLKLDENLGERGADLFRSAAHDVATVCEQKLTSSSDQEIRAACRAEQRCLVTLDLDFGSKLYGSRPWILPVAKRQKARRASIPAPSYKRHGFLLSSATIT